MPYAGCSFSACWMPFGIASSLWRIAASLRSFSTSNPYPPDFKAKDEDGETLGHQLVFNLCNCCCLHLSTWCQLAGAGTPAEARALSEIQVCSWSPHVPSISTVLCDRGTLELQAEVPWAWPCPRTSHVSQEKGEPIQILELNPSPKGQNNWGTRATRAILVLHFFLL